MNNGYNRRNTDNNAVNSKDQNFNFADENIEMNTEEYMQYENIGRRNSDKINNNLNAQTFINIDGSQPIGLDLKGFMNNISCDQTVHAISQSNDLPIISEVFIEIKLFDLLNRMKDPAVSNDFFYYCFVKNDITKVPLTMDNVITIMPHVIQLTNSKYDVYLKNGIKTAWNILKFFHDRIISAKSVVVMGGVDFAREDRLKKCDSIIEQYEIILNSAILAKIVTNQKNDELFKLTTGFLTELDYFLKQCRKNN